MIEFDDVSFAYETGCNVLSGVSLCVEPGRIVAVAGANGSGKSTLALLANGLLVPGRGAVRVDDMDVSDDELVWKVRERVGMVMQNPDDQIVGALAEEDVAFGPENLGMDPEEMRDVVAESLSAVGLSDMRRREPHTLSEGQKQRLAVAGVLAMRPAYVVLDEPTAMLDPVGRRDIEDIVDRLAHVEGRGVLFVTHRPAEIALADEAIVLAEGVIVWQGRPAELLADEMLMRELGLAPGPIARLGAALRDRGIAVPPTAQRYETVAEALWPSS
jgi:energy-coupling factor transport system ATP-binding protein